MGSFNRTNVRILSADEKNELDAWVYTPTNNRGPYPAVVMAHGFGLNKAHGLQSYAEPFASSGRLVIVFDYRHLGASDGFPREHISVSSQLQDFKTVLDWTKSRDDVKKEALVAWGYSYSGGHVHTLAATYPGLAGVIAQNPYMSAIHTVISLSQISELRIAPAVIWDTLARALTFLPPAYVGAAGGTGDYAVLAAPGSKEGFQFLETFAADEVEQKEKMEKLGSKHMRIRASGVSETFVYSPVFIAKRIKIPLMTVVAANDKLCPPKQPVQAANQCGGEVVRTPGGHFGAYRGGPTYDQSLEAHLRFLDKVAS